MSISLQLLAAIRTAADVHEMFKLLGFQVYDPEPFEGEGLNDLELDDADRAMVKRAYIIAQHGSYTIYLYEVHNLRAARLRGLAWNLLQRGKELLIVTQDYRELLVIDPRFAGGANKSSVRLNKLKIVVADATRHDLDTLNALHAFNRTGDQIYAAQADAFNVNTVTTRFYNEYRRHYERARDAAAQYNKGVRDFYDQDKLHAFTQRLLGRLMFLYFLQRKGWLGGKGRFLTDHYLTTVRKSAGEGEGETFGYYRDVLQPLFFETLNLRRPDNITRWEGVRIPYLNGGLFDDSRDPQRDILLPDSLFDANGDGILAFFNRYNFTIADDTPLEQDVAVDPEMLGKVFENLLEERERGQSGSFYTPRAIVAYMCQEALAGYLEESADIPRDVTRVQFDPDRDEPFTPEQAGRAGQALDTLTVLDPAVGSGSFLIGMMTEIIRLRRACWQTLTPQPPEENALTPQPPLPSEGEGEQTPSFLPSPSTGRGAGGEGHGRIEIPLHVELEMKAIARQFRKQPTASEDILWQALRDRQLDGRKFRRQQPIGPFVVDFFCPAERLVVEVDGGVHEIQREADAARQSLIESVGYRFVRLPAALVETNLSHALTLIRAAFIQALTLQPPLPSEGEGAQTPSFLPSPGTGRGAGGEGIPAEPPPALVAAWKEAIIRDTLYGVDIKPEAIEIAQLRLWLALVVDQTLEQAHPLPNLDYRLMAGNSLIETIDGEPVLGAEAEAMLAGQFRDDSAAVLPVQASLGLFDTQRAAQQERARLKDLRREFFDAAPDARKALRERIVSQERQIVYASLREKADALQGQIDHYGKLAGQGRLKKNDEKKLAEAVAKLKRLTDLQGALANPDMALPFFLYRLHFNDVFERKGGFDIVVANPPYVDQRRITEQKAEFERIYSDVYSGNADLYVYFFARSLQLVRNFGMLAFITSNKYMRSPYGEKLRKVLTTTCSIAFLIDFADLPVFDAAAYPAIFIGTKTTPIQNKVTALAIEDADLIENLSQAVTKYSDVFEQDKLQDGQWQITNLQAHQLLKRLSAENQLLSELAEISFYRGISTGLNQAFVIRAESRENIILKDAKAEQVIKPYLSGREIQRWKINAENEYLLFISWDFPLQEYPSIAEHLTIYKTQLAARPEVREGRFQWYALSRYASNYYREFEKPKIVWAKYGLKTVFAYDTIGLYPNNTSFIMPTYDLFYLGVMNSDVISFCARLICNTVRGGYMEFNVHSVGKFPIPNPPADLRERIAQQAQRCLDAAAADPDRLPALEAHLNTLVYQAYGLDADDIRVIEGYLAGQGRSGAVAPTPDETAEE